MNPDTSTRENSALERRPTLLCEAGATHSVRNTFADWSWVTKRTWILACLRRNILLRLIEGSEL